MLIEKSYLNLNPVAQFKLDSRIKSYNFEPIKTTKPIQPKQIAR